MSARTAHALTGAAPHHAGASPWRSPTPRRRRRGAAAQHSVVGFDLLAGHGQPELVQTAERIVARWG